VLATPSKTEQAIPVNQRLIVALDVSSIEAAKALVQELGNSVQFYKLGLELAMSGAYFELLTWLRKQDKHIFADLKFYDIPATVGAAVNQLAGLDISFLTVHGDQSILEAAAEHKGSRLQILAVTVLTSLDQDALRQMGINIDISTLVLSRAKQALTSGCDGVIASGLETPILRSALGKQIIIVTPGIRSSNHGSADDQKRVVTVRQAFENGCDYIVVGRPIRNASSPRAAAETIQEEITDAIQKIS